MKDVEKMVDSNGVVMQIVDGAARDMIAAEYDATASYAVGDYCIYNDHYYKCITAIPSGGETWDATHWSVTTLGAEERAIKSSLSQKVNMVRLNANLTIDYADPASIGYRTTEATKIDVTGLTGYPTGKTVLGSLAWGNDIYGSIIWVDNSNYLRGASKTSGTIAVNILVLYLD